MLGIVPTWLKIKYPISYSLYIFSFFLSILSLLNQVLGLFTCRDKEKVSQVSHAVIKWQDIDSTPLILYPNHLGILFHFLHGHSECHNKFNNLAYKNLLSHVKRWHILNYIPIFTHTNIGKNCTEAGKGGNGVKFAVPLPYPPLFLFLGGIYCSLISK